MKLKHFIISGAIIIVLISTLAFTQRANVGYEYMTIVQSNFTGTIYINKQNQDIESIKLEKGSFEPSNGDQRAALSMVSEYEAKGPR